MKKLVLVVAVILVLLVSAVVGCTNKGLVGTSPEEGQEMAGSCVTCHTDKDTLKEVASPEPEQETSEETTGEG